MKSELSILDGWRVYHCYLGSPRDGLVPYSGPTHSCLLLGQLFLHGFSVFPEYVAQPRCWLFGWSVGFVVVFFFFLILSWGYTLGFLYNTRYPTKILFSPLIIYTCFDNLFQILYMTHTHTPTQKLMVNDSFQSLRDIWPTSETRAARKFFLAQHRPMPLCYQLFYNNFY